MDIALVVGIGLTLVAIVVAMVIDGNSAAALVSPSSFVMVFFGSIGAAAAGYRLADVLRAPKAAVVAITGKAPNPDQVVTQLMEFADVARRQGVLAMEPKLEEVEDPFVRTGLQALVDGLDQEAVRAILDAELQSVNDRHHVIISVFRSLAGFAPTMGMVGTVIGLVNMLGNLSDPSQLGSSMALALLTTLYGVLFANVVFMPVASRLTRLHESEIQVKEMVRDAVLAIQIGISPRALVDRLERYLEPSRRVGARARAEQGLGEVPAGQEAAA